MGSLAGTIDRWAKTFFLRKKEDEDFFEKKLGGKEIYWKKEFSKKTFMRPKSKVFLGQVTWVCSLEQNTYGHTIKT